MTETPLFLSPMMSTGRKAPTVSLFHPKKSAKKAVDRSPTKGKAAAPRPPPAAEDDDELILPDDPYTEYKLMSSSLNGWKYDVMKFDSHKPVDISAWPTPIKLNRKDLRRDEPAAEAPKPAGPMLGPDGKPVIGADGRMVMVDMEGRPIQPIDPAKANKAKGPLNGRKKFQKKTRQVFVVPEEQRQLRREERYPWVMEDSTGGETWVGQLDDTSRSATHAFFMPAANDVFKFVPAHRWYRFQKKFRHRLPTGTADVESLYNRSQRVDPHLLFQQHTGRSPSAATAATLKAENEEDKPAQSLGPGGRKLKTVDSGMDSLFGDDDDEDSKAVRRRQKKEMGEEGDLDEMTFEEEFADDDEKVEGNDNDDEEAKETEERIKREYKEANKQREGYVDDSDEEEAPPDMSQGAKAMKKMLKKTEGEAYESDEDNKNPYASSEESEEEEIPVNTPVSPAVPGPGQAQQSRSATPKASSTSRPTTGPSTSSRATSPSLGGHSVVAKRATSPKAPRPGQANGAIGSSPLASGSNGVRATSPANKRKAADDGPQSPTSPNGTEHPKTKKRKSTVSAANPPVGDLDESMIIDWLRNTPGATTKSCIQHFRPYFTDNTKKERLASIVKQVAFVKDGLLVLKSSYRDGSSASPSRAGSPTA